MRVCRWLIAAVSVSGVLVTTAPALADGGAYIDFDRTHYVVGSTGKAETYVAVPRSKASLLERGPFYAYLLPRSTSLLEGRPVPAGSVRVGAFAVEHERGASYELKATISIPAIASGYYEIAVCNDPCTINGFREPLSGTISVVQSTREGALLTQNGRLKTQVFRLERSAKREAKETEAALAAAQDVNTRLVARIEQLEGQLHRVRSAGSARPLIDGWAAVIVAGLFAIAAGLRRRRRTRRAVAPTRRKPTDQTATDLVAGESGEAPVLAGRSRQPVPGD